MFLELLSILLVKDALRNFYYHPVMKFQLATN